jgi:serine/threonine protein kinase
MIGTTIAQYEILEKLGSGGMGVVYKAKDTRLNRFTALKFLPQELDVSKTDKERFIREARAASALDHQNICTVYEIGQTDEGQMYIAMAYYEGETLKSVMANGPLPVKQAIEIALQIARGMSKAHSQGIIHRDVKPANLMVTTEGIVKILDFGLAKSQGAALTKPGTIMGTVSYMSPEQTQSQIVDHRTDIWSLGVVIYEMLTGVSPFKKNNEAATIYAIVYKEPEQIKNIREDVPDELEGVVARCLSKNPDSRLQNMDALIAELQVFEKLPETAPVVTSGVISDPESSATLTMPPPIRELDAGKKGQPLQKSVRKPIEKIEQKPPLPPVASKSKPRIAIPVFLFGLIALIAALVYFTDLEQNVLQLFDNKKPAVLSVDSTPVGATVFLNDDSIGTTPLEDFRLQEGEARISLQKAGYARKDSTRHFRSGQQARLQFMLIPEPPVVDPKRVTINDSAKRITDRTSRPESGSGSKTTNKNTMTGVAGPPQITTTPAKLTLQAIPAGNVQILDFSPFKSALTPEPFILNAGTYTVRFRHPGYGTRDTTLVLQAGEEKSVTCYFVNYLNVQTLMQDETPLWANVIVDGRNTEKTTPLYNYALEPGQHTISVMKSGYTTLNVDQKISVHPTFSKRVIRLVFYIRKNG